LELIVEPDPPALARAAARLFRDRVTARPDLVMAVPAGRTPRAMYAVLRDRHGLDGDDFSAMHVVSVDELCPPAPEDGYFWRQVRREFLAWAGVPAAQCHPFRVDATDLATMCTDYEAAIGALGGLDLVMLGLGPNGHLASNEPGTPFTSRTRPVKLLPATVAYILTDEVRYGPVCDEAVTLGLSTILAAREVVVLVSGAGKREALRRAVAGPVTPDVPASVLQRHPRCTVLADREAAG
jgi:glucosamine-6-phosphate deaminase